MTAAPSSSSSSGPFHHRAPDRRLVRNVVSLLHQPPHWLPMDLQDVECKLMEVKKFSAPYYEIDSKFRRPNLHLVSAYAVQNPFLWGSFVLRREQLKMQLANIVEGEKHILKEKLLFYPTNFRNMEVIARNNFAADWKGGHDCKFYANAQLANDAMSGDSNPRIMIVARVLTGICRDLPHEDRGEHGHHHHHHHHHPQRPHLTADGLVVDTLTDKNVFIKGHVNEVYPEHVLIYRDTSKGADNRSSRLTDVIKYCQISYRAGTRFNPDEITFAGSGVGGRTKKKKDPVAAAATQQPVEEEENTGAVKKRANVRRSEGSRSPDVEVPLLSASGEDSIERAPITGEKKKKPREE